MTFGSRFLVHPDHFPAATTGQPWGERSVTLDVASPVCFVGLNTKQLAAVEARYGSDLAGVGPPDGSVVPVVQCLRLERETFVLFDRTGWEYTVDLDAAAERVLIVGYNFAGLIRLSPFLAGTFWTCEDDDNEFRAAIENFYRTFTAYQALALGGILLHSAAVVYEGRAFVFFSHSGAGKSTLAGNAVQAGHTILSDDLNLVLAGGGVPTVRRVPFAGTYGRAQAKQEIYPLAALIRLKQGVNVRRRLSPATAFAAMIGSSPFVNRDPYRYPRLAEVADDLLERFTPWQVEAAREGFDQSLLEPPAE